jgi:hypothetical protein
MTHEDVALWIQVAAVLAAVGAAIIALVVSAKDRANARIIAQEDRQVSLQQSKLLVDLENLTRLLENRNRGGSLDKQERDRLGAEALTLVGLIGRERLPQQWGRTVELDDAGLRGLMSDADTPEFMKDAIEAQLAVNAITAEIRLLLQRS